MSSRAAPTTYPGNAETRALSAALAAAGGWTPCEGVEPTHIDPAACSGCAVVAECGDLGRAIRATGTFGGARLVRGKVRPPR